MGTKEEILIAAERMFAERGFDVSLREIGAAAGQRNNSAVQYHFGDKAGLVDALYEFRMVPLNRRRRELLDAARPAGDVAALVDAYLGPLAEHVLTGTSWYLRFAVRYLLSGSYRNWPFSTDHYAPFAEVVDLLVRARPELTPDRLRVVHLHVLATLADVEQRIGEEGFNPGAAVADLAVTTRALLTAPIPLR